MTCVTSGEGRRLGNKRSKASTQETDDTDTDKDTCASASDAPEVHDDNEVDSDFDNEAPALISEDSQSDDDDDTASVNSTAKANTQTGSGPLKMEETSAPAKDNALATMNQPLHGSDDTEDTPARVTCSKIVQKHEPRS